MEDNACSSLSGGRVDERGLDGGGARDRVRLPRMRAGLELGVERAPQPFLREVDLQLIDSCLANETPPWSSSPSVLFPS